MDTDTTNLVGGEDTADDATLNAGTEVEAEGDSFDSAEFDEDGNPVDGPSEDEEIELDDLKLKVPKDQAQKVKEALLRQADYTRKTQEVAEARKALESEKQQFQNASQEELGVAATAINIANQLAAFNQVNWDAWEAEDPFEAQRGWRQFQQLKDTHGQALGRLNQLRTARVSAQQQEIATRVEQTKAALSKDIPGWSEDLKAKLNDFGAKEYGFTADELADMNIDPRIAKVLHAAFEHSQAKSKAKTAQRHLTAQQVEPAATTKARTAPPTGLDDRLSTEEWMRRRNAQLRNKAGR